MSGWMYAFHLLFTPSLSLTILLTHIHRMIQRGVFTFMEPLLLLLLLLLLSFDLRLSPLWVTTLSQCLYLSMSMGGLEEAHFHSLSRIGSQRSLRGVPLSPCHTERSHGSKKVLLNTLLLFTLDWPLNYYSSIVGRNHLSRQGGKRIGIEMGRWMGRSKVLSIDKLRSEIAPLYLSFCVDGDSPFLPIEWV